jgi:hypothetical protein
MRDRGSHILYVVLLRFSSNKIKAGEFIPAHNAWIERGESGLRTALHGA